MNELVLEELNDGFLNILGEVETTRPEIYYGDGTVKGSDGEKDDGERGDCKTDSGTTCLVDACDACVKVTCTSDCTGDCPSNCIDSCQANCTPDSSVCEEDCRPDCDGVTCFDDYCLGDIYGTHTCRDATCLSDDHVCNNDDGGCGSHQYLCELHGGCPSVKWATCFNNSLIGTTTASSRNYWNGVKINIKPYGGYHKKNTTYPTFSRIRLMSGTTVEMNRIISLLIRHSGALSTLSASTKEFTVSGYTAANWFGATIHNLDIPIWLSSTTHMQTSASVTVSYVSYYKSASTSISNFWNAMYVNNIVQLAENTSIMKIVSPNGKPLEGVYIQHDTTKPFYTSFPQYRTIDAPYPIRTGLNGKILVASSAFTGTTLVYFYRKGYNGTNPFTANILPNVETVITAQTANDADDFSVASTLYLSQINPRIFDGFSTLPLDRNYTTSQLLALKSGVTADFGQTSENLKQILTYRDINNVGIDNVWGTNEYLYAAPSTTGNSNVIAYTSIAVSITQNNVWSNVTPYLHLGKQYHYIMISPVVFDDSTQNQTVACQVQFSAQGTTYTSQPYYLNFRGSTPFIIEFNALTYAPGTTDFNGDFYARMRIQRTSGTGTTHTVTGTCYAFIHYLVRRTASGATYY